MNDEQIKALVDAINNLASAILAQSSATAKPDQPKPKPKVVKSKAKAAPKAEPAQEQVTDLEVVRKALMSFAQTHGKELAKQLLAEFNAKKLGDLKTNEYDQLIERINQQLNQQQEAA